MEQNTLGIMLSYYREKYKLSMEQVCDGICSVAALHRIEKGSREVDSLVGERLLGRIGKEANQFELMLGDEDYACWQVRKQILGAMKQKNYDEAKKAIAVYRKTSAGLPEVHKQFYLYYEGIIATAAKDEKEKILDLFSEAFYCTRKENGKRRLYNQIEIDIALKLIHYKYPTWRKCSRDMIDELLFVTDQYYTGQQKEDAQAEIWMELIYLAEEQGSDRNLLSYIDQAVDAIGKGRRMRYLGELHFKKAQVIMRCYRDTKEWMIQEESCKKECLMAYYVFEVMRKRKEQTEVQRFCGEKMGWHITEQETLFD